MEQGQVEDGQVRFFFGIDHLVDNQRHVTHRSHQRDNAPDLDKPRQPTTSSPTTGTKGKRCSARQRGSLCAPPYQSPLTISTIDSMFLPHLQP